MDTPDDSEGRAPGGEARAGVAAVERRARELGCCKVTLEVREHNHRARGVYAAAGFAQAVYVPEAGGSLHLSKTLWSLDEGDLSDTPDPVRPDERRETRTTGRRRGRPDVR